jgi:hypothetical protein
MSGLIEKISHLRRLAPSLETRDQAPAAQADLQGLSDVRPLDSLLDAIADCPQEKTGAQDKVILHLDLDLVQGIYCERGPAGPGDSGWTIGAIDPSSAVNNVAIPVAELQQACPFLQPVLALPRGYFVLLDEPEQTQALADAQDTLIWSTRLEGSAK